MMERCVSIASACAIMSHPVLMMAAVRRARLDRGDKRISEATGLETD